jgi:hypothetical protein
MRKVKSVACNITRLEPGILKIKALIITSKSTDGCKITGFETVRFFVQTYVLFALTRT